LPAIDKPEIDMIAKQLRRDEFTEPQIREMKHHRKFILICDGYDESQQPMSTIWLLAVKMDRCTSGRLRKKKDSITLRSAG
jgi:hypothetical protein